MDSAWKAVLMAKIAVVVLAGLGVLLHQRATTKRGLALWGSVGGLASVAALVMGILLGRVTPNTTAAFPGVRNSGPGMGLTWNPVHRPLDSGEGEHHAR